MPKKVRKHSLLSLNNNLKLKKINNIIKVIAINDNLITVEDIDFGKYQVDIKSFCKKTNFPLHKTRKHLQKLNKLRKQYLGKEINKLKIIDIFYGPDRGYKNRSFYVKYIGTCGHEGISTYATLTKHKKTFLCSLCCNIKHGERTKIEGILKKRTSTYTYWVKVKDTLPEIYKDYEKFKLKVGEKPKKAKLYIDGLNLYWIDLTLTEDRELNLIATAIRQAFRHSEIYKKCIENSRVETEKGPRYKCSNCNNLFKRSQIQVDHIDPIQPINGDKLNKDTLIDRIWTHNVQILDKSCHSKKSSLENKLRKQNKLKKSLTK